MYFHILRLTFCILVLACPLFAEVSQPVTRVVYANEPILLDPQGGPLKGKALGERLELLRDVLGTEIYLLDYVLGLRPATPVRIPGTVIHIDSSPGQGDQNWVIGEDNPMLDFSKVRAAATRLFPGIVDLDEKYDGYRFIKNIVPEHAAPPMKLGNEFVKNPISRERLATLEAQVDATMRKYGQDPAVAKDLRERTLRLAVIRERINSDLGTSFIKTRGLSHSEGKLPKSNKDWVEMYVDYILNVQPIVKEAEAKAVRDSIALPELLVEIDRVEGRILDLFLDNPGDVIVQKKEELHREVRIHFIYGQVLPDSTYLRFYGDNEYLPRHEKKAFESFFGDVLVPALKRAGIHPAGFSMTPDLVLLKRPGLDEALEKAKRGDYRALYPFISVLDENLDMQSGYLFPDEDLFTTGQFGKRFTGKDSRFLRDFEEYKALPRGAAKDQRLREIQARYAPFLAKEDTEAFSDRVIAHQIDLLGKNPTPAELERAISEMKAAGLNTKNVLLQLTNEARDLYGITPPFGFLCSGVKDLVTP